MNLRALYSARRGPNYETNNGDFEVAYLWLRNRNEGDEGKNRVVGVDSYQQEKDKGEDLLSGEGVPPGEIKFGELKSGKAKTDAVKPEKEEFREHQ